MDNTTGTPLINSNINSSSSSSSSSSSFAFGIFVELIFVWTIVGNSIIIAVLKLYKPLTIPDILVFSLALSDLLNVLLPAQILNIIQSQFFNLTWTKSTCAAFTGLVYFLRLSSVLTVSVISLDRLIAIRKPLLYRSRVMHEIGRVKVLILILWLFSCFTASLPFMGVSEWSFSGNECPYQLLDLGLYYGFYIEILGLLQLALVLYCYIAIRISTWHFLKRQGKFRRAQLNRTISNQPRIDQDESNVEATALHIMSRQGSNAELTIEHSTEQRSRLPTYEQKAKRGPFIKNFGSKRRSSAVPFRTEGMKQVAKMEKMMAVLVFLFYLTWIPFLGSNLHSLVTGKSNKNITKIIGVFSLINGFLNPIVYATIYPRYKKGYVFVLRSIFRICGGKKPSITLADFNSSKIGRSRRLQTLKELKMSTVRESEAPQIRQGWLRHTPSTSAMVTAEHIMESQSNRNENDLSTYSNENVDPRFQEDVETSKNENEFELRSDNERGMCHIAAECLVPNCIECKDRRGKGCRNENGNVVSPTFVQIGNVSPTESTREIGNNSDAVQRQQLSRCGSSREMDPNDFTKYKIKWDPTHQDSSCNGKDVHNSKIEIKGCLTDSDNVGFEGDDNCNTVIRNTQSPMNMKTISDIRTSEENCYQVLPNSAYVNDGFTKT